MELLTKRKAENAVLYPRSPWVFPSATSRSGHIREGKKKPARVPFMLHDLRRTFATVAEPIVPGMRLKLLLNHALPKSDVTAGYLVYGVEDLRQPMQMVTDALLHLCNPTQVDGKVVRIRKTAS